MSEYTENKDHLAATHKTRNFLHTNVRIHSSHFATGHGKNPETYLTITAKERAFPLKDDLLRKRRESHWINVYDSVKFGANTRD